ncbi:MAG: CCA tRNA nucleotidyltransferase [Victivallaceae bacterium]|nr:CCA tRNA nucleotidyltransferase [Victivallaceae bacterium]
MKINVPRNPEFDAAADAVSRIRADGFEAMLVGGSVRDMLLGRSASDIDIVTTARPDDISRMFPGSLLVGRSFGVTILKNGEFKFEAATAREERSYMDGRHPDEVKFTEDLSVDVLRRDFTINALMLDPVTGEVADYVGGVDDLRHGVLRTVGDPGTRFKEDYLRMLRAVRFASRLGFEIERQTEDAMKLLAPLTAKIARERVRAELDMMLMTPRAEQAFRIMERLEILSHILPEVAALRGVEQPPQFHPEGDVFEHTMLMLRHMVLPARLLGWCILLHDIGKPASFRRDDTGRIRFFGHESMGAEIAKNILTDLRFPADDIESITAVIAGHMRMGSIPGMKEAKLRMLMARPTFSLDMELNRIDCLCSNGIMDGFLVLADRLAENKNIALPEPFVMGRDLLAIGAKPGPAFGKVLATIFEEQLSGTLPDRNAALKRAAGLLGISL